MPSWTQDELDAYLRKISSTVPKPPVCHEPLAAPPGKKAHPEICEIRVTSFRRRLCDPDNLAIKYFVDALRYEGIIRDDTPDHVRISIGQTKVSTKAEEGTEIVINWP